MLTIFTTAKPFRGQIKVIQTNAIQSWTLLRPACEIILFGDEEGTAEVAAKQGIRHVIDVERNEYGTPLISDMFKIAQEIASYPLMCYVNSDIILTSGFLPAISQVRRDTFLLVGQRWDVDLKVELDFSDPNWEEQLRSHVAEVGTLHGPSGLDYFVFSRGLYRDMPPFAVGRTAWDGWMTYRARSLGVPVIDATDIITVIHQNHDYSHYPGGKTGVWGRAEANRNRGLAKRSHYVIGLHNATLILTPKGLRPALTRKHLWLRLRAMYHSTPCPELLSIVIRHLVKPLKMLGIRSQRKSA